MCAIIASFNPGIFYKLYQLNSYRGALTYSVADFIVGDNIKMNSTIKSYGVLDPSIILDNGNYLIGHSQAPTTNNSQIHPAIYTKALLWHNGIIKQKEIESGTWDTQWMLNKIYDYGFKTLSDMDGSFACIMYNGVELFVFRNEISPLFYDDDLNFSSTKFDGSKSLPPNIVFGIGLKDKKLVRITEFSTKENPYYFAEA